MYVIISFIFTNENNISHESNHLFSNIIIHYRMYVIISFIFTNISHELNHFIFQYYNIIIDCMLLFLLFPQTKTIFHMNQIIYFSIFLYHYRQYVIISFIFTKIKIIFQMNQIIYFPIL